MQFRSIKQWTMHYLPRRACERGWHRWGKECLIERCVVCGKPKFEGV